MLANLSFIFSKLLEFVVAVLCSATTVFICMSWIVLEKVARDKKSISLTSYLEFLRDTFLLKKARTEKRKERHKLRNLKATQSYEVIDEEKWVNSNIKKGALVRVPPEFYEHKYSPPRQNIGEPGANSNSEHHRVGNMLEIQHRTQDGLARDGGKQRYIRDDEWKDTQAYESKEVYIPKNYKRSKTEQRITPSGGNPKKHLGPHSQSHRQLSPQRRDIEKDNKRQKNTASGLTTKEVAGKYSQSHRQLPHHKPGDSVVILERAQTGLANENNSDKIISKPI